MGFWGLGVAWDCLVFMFGWLFWFCDVGLLWVLGGSGVG